MPYQNKLSVYGPEATQGLDLNSNKHKSTAMPQYSRNYLVSTPTRSPYRRYSLADVKLTSPTSKQKSLSNNSHISTRIDSRSPGYSTRVVQYNEEQEKSLSTHQKKYDKLGVFPIVHVFKRDLPFLKRKGNEFSNQINSDLSKYNSPEQNRMLLEKIIKSNPGGSQCTTPLKNEASTKSVLDALKEISRKRIHSNGEEFILKEDGKRMHVDYDNESSSRKRLKQSAHVDNTAVANSSMRSSSIDELTASHSSMEGYFMEKPQPVKSHGHMSSQLEPTIEPVKHVDVETQTIAPQTTEVIEPVDLEKPEKEVMDLNNSQQEIKTKRPSPIKVFDETPLETMRKNRLSVLMGSLSSSKTQAEKTNGIANNEEKSIFSKPLVSILSGSSKSPQKSNKHVTFDIPESVNSTAAADGNVSLITPSNFNIPKSSDEGNMVTKTSAVIIAPIVCTSITESITSQKVSTNAAKHHQHEVPSVSLDNTNVSVVSPVVPTAAQFSMTLIPPNLIFGNAVPSSQSQQDKHLKTKLEGKSTEFNTNRNDIKETPNMSQNINKSSATQFSGPTSLGQNGGFKFDLKESQSTAATKISPLPFSLMTSSAASGNATSTTFSPAFSTVVTTSKESSTVFVVPNSSSQVTSHIFSDVGMNKQPNLPSFSTNMQSTTSHATNNFGSKIPPPNFVIPSSATSKTPLFTFDSNSKVTAATKLNFASPTVSSTSTNSLNFPATSVLSSSLNFGLQANAGSSSAFIKPSGSFVTSPSSIPTSSQAFPGNAATTSTSFFFGSPNKGPVPSGNNNDNVSTFNSNGAAKSIFGQNTVPSFGMGTSSFGSNNMQGSNAFATTGTTPTNVPRNSGSTFGTSSEVPTFGTGTAANFAVNAFGKNQNLGFNANLNNDPKSGANFGASYNNAFGASSNTPGFNTTVTTASMSFTSNGNFTQTNNVFSSTFGTTSPFDKTAGSANASTFGTTSPFDKSTGATNTNVTPFNGTNPTFGSGNFSSNPQPTQSGVFSFGTNTNSKPPVFSFGTNEPPKPSFNFQTENNSNAFNLSNKGFGSSTPSAFNTLPAAPPFQSPGAPMFSIGTGGSPAPIRSRTQHKAKRRT